MATEVRRAFLVFLFLVSMACVALARPQERNYPIRLQPELDVIDVEDYFRNDRLFRLQVKCVIHDGPCDAVGRWIKPRVAAAFYGECPLCTETQKENVEKLVAFIQEKHPEVYKQAVAKFLKSAGIDTPSSGSTTAASQASA